MRDEWCRACGGEIMRDDRCRECGTHRDDGRAVRYGQNLPMPQTSKEKQEAFRARQALLGLKEVRGIYLPPELHQALKAHAEKLLKQAEKNPTNGS